jgi:hypothetical protein
MAEKTEQTCQQCRVTIVCRDGRDRSKRYCSVRCRRRAKWLRRRMSTRTCAQCGAPLPRVPPSRRNRQRFCSHRCARYGALQPRCCDSCGTQYRPTSAGQRWCSSCIPNYSARTRQYKYGMSQQQFAATIAQQGGGCAICGDTKNLCVDHRHGCCRAGRACQRCRRGVLCGRCNTWLAALEKDSGWLTAARRYIEERRRTA